MAIPLDYLFLRVVRHFLPEFAVRFLLHRSLIIKPGLETKNSASAIQNYLDTLSTQNISLEGKRVLVFGYGGNYAIGVQFLNMGASHVVLADKFAIPDGRRNRALLPTYQQYLKADGKHVVPNREFITLIRGDIDPVDIDPVDIVVSNSVYEHLTGDAMEAITWRLAAVTKPDGIHLHFIDLRDHYFKYPFAMLAFSKKTWQTWLNPTSNLNRFRCFDFQDVFESCFDDVKLTVLARDETKFLAFKRRIRSEFLTGDDAVDAITLISVIAYSPRVSG